MEQQLAGESIDRVTARAAQHCENHHNTLDRDPAPCYTALNRLRNRLRLPVPKSSHNDAAACAESAYCLHLVSTPRKGPFMVTIHDVAVRAGVSATTVSHVVNGTRPVSSQLSERVHEATRELGYQPNALARSLRRKETHTIGLIVPDNSNPFFAEMAHSVEYTAYGSGHAVVLCNSDDDVEREALYLDLLLKRQVDGIVLVAAATSGDSLRALNQRGLPLVVVDRDLPYPAHDCVLTDHEAGGYAATEHLAQLGHKRIACIAGPSDLGSSTGRVAGHRAALRAAGLRVDQSMVVRGDFRDHSGYVATQKLLKRAKPPTAIFACNDLMAIGAMAAARDAGLNVPEDISVVGFDDIHLAGYLNPPLTTIAQPMAELGRGAVELLLERLLDRSLPPRRVMLRNRLVIRRTTAVAPAQASFYFVE